MKTTSRIPALLLLAALATPLPSPADAAGPRPVAVTEEADRLVVTWRPGAGALVGRVALPPGRTAVLAGPRAWPAGAVELGAGGWEGRLPFAELRLDPARLPAGAEGVLEVVVQLVPGPPPGAAPLGRASDAALAAREAAGALLPGFLNPSAAREARAAASLGVTAPPAPPAPRRGFLRRSPPPVPRSLDGPRGLPRELGDAGAAEDLAGGRVKVQVDRDGVYRVTGAELEAAGVDLSGLPAVDLRLVTRSPDGGPARDEAVEVAVRVEDRDGDGLFEAEDFLELWGVALTRDWQPGYFQGADFGDVNAYLLDALPGDRLRMARRDAAPAGGLPDAVDSLATVRAEVNDWFLGNHRTRQFGVDHFYWCPSLAWSGRSDVTREEQVPLPSLNPASARAAAVRLRALARQDWPTVDPDHHTYLDLNGANVSERFDEGFVVIDHDATGLDASALTDPLAVGLRVGSPGPAAASSDRLELDWIEVDYPRLLVATDDQLAFVHEPGFTATVTALSADEVTVLDVTDAAAPVLLDGAATGGGAARFEIEGTADVALAVAAWPAGPPAVRPAGIVWVPASDLRSPSLRADVIVLGSRELLEPPTAGLVDYQAWRQSQGLAVKVVTYEEVIDEVADGLPSALALPSFLNLALTAWQAPAPRYLLLVGDANVDYKGQLRDRVLQPGDCSALPDPCGFGETASVQHVPTRVFDVPSDDLFLGYYGSDASFALAVGDDWWPDVAVGRLPVRDRAGLDAVLAKAQAYESLAGAPPPWAARTLMVADRVQSAGDEVFETLQDDAAAEHLEPRFPRRTFYYESDYGGADPAALTADLLAAWADPAESGAVVSYVGHGSAFRWSGLDLFVNADQLACRDDAETLAGPSIPMPIVVNANCITGAFMHLVGPSILEELVRAPEGGAIAALGPTGITFLSDADEVLDAFFGGTHGRDACDLRLGDVLRRVQDALVPAALAGAPAELLSNVLLGDPATKPVIPRGPAGAAVRATGGDGVIDVEWDAVPGADLYDLFRAEGDPPGDFALLAGDLAATAWRDEGLVNGTAYTYAVQPLAGGFPGCWSPPASARPCQPEAPEPPSRLDPRPGTCAGCILTFWTPSPSSDVARYVIEVHHGTEATDPVERRLEIPHPGSLTNVCGLVPFRDYALTIKAVSWCGVESAIDGPVVQRATCPLAVDRPAFVADLRATRQGNDVLLDWSPVTSTVRGDPLTPDAYLVYRADRPDFPGAAGDELTAVAAPPFTDPARVGDGVRLEYWAVAAASGPLRGGVGHDFPQGVRDLRREDAGTEWHLTFSPVVHDLRGERTPVARYLVHASPTPIGRAEVEGRAPDLVVAAPEALIDRALGDFHVVVPEDVHDNASLE